MRTEYAIQRPHLTSYVNNTFSTHTSLNKTTRMKKSSPMTPALSKASTDDVTFALTEVSNLDKKIRKINDNRKKIWKHRVDNNFYETEAMHNHLELQQIKDRVRRTGGWETINLRREIDKKKYFPVEQVETLMASDHIKTQLNFRKQRNDKYQDLYTFAVQNRDICLKNILIELLQSECNTIAVKENEVSNALESANQAFNKDVKEFHAFTEHQKGVFHNIELKLTEKIRINKTLMEDKRSLTMEYKSIQEEIEKNIRGIIQNKQHADFVHTVLGGSPEILNADISHIDLMKKDRDIDKIISSIKKQFAFLNNPNYDPGVLQNPILLNNLFFQLEANIIKYINLGEDIRNDLYKLQLENNEILNDLEEKEKRHIKEYKSVLNDSVSKTPLITINDDLNEELRTNRKMIIELYDTLKGDDDEDDTNNDKRNSIFKTIKNKQSIEIIKEIFSELDKKEHAINLHQEELSKMENESPDILKKIVDKNKNKNKIQKWREGKEKLRLFEEQKNLKYQQRSNRYKLRGQVTYPLPGILQKKKISEKQKHKQNVADYDMLFY